MSNGSILIISNNENIGKKISSKIKLLRDCDTIKLVSYIEAISVLNSTQPSMIMVYCSNSDSVRIIKEIRTLKALDKVPIIFVTDKFVEELLLYAFDNGIDDFFFLSDPDSIILMRILLTLQKSILYKQIDINNEILISADIIEKQTGLYKKEQASLAMRNFFSKCLEENLENAVFMCIKPVLLENNKRLNLSKIAQIIKSIPRGNDIVAYGKNNGFYFILYNAGIVGAKSVSNRIKNALSKICKIYTTAAEITMSFEEMEPILLQSLKDQISTDKEFNYLHELKIEETAEFIDIKDENGKRFKDFQKEFYKNFELIVTPIFSEVQKKAQATFPNAKVVSTIKETESLFVISEGTVTSELLITYPTYIKLLMDIKHEEEGTSPTIIRLTFDFEDFSSEKLNSILNDVIAEFSSKLNTQKTHSAE